MVLLVGSFACLTAIGIAAYPAPASAAFALLLGLAVAVGLCLPASRTPFVCLPAGLAFVLISLDLSVLGGHPAAAAGGLAAATAGGTLYEPGKWAPILVGAGMFQAAALVAAWSSAALRALPAELPTSAGRAARAADATVGRERAERELAAAAAEEKLVTLGLIGVDSPEDEDEEAANWPDVMRDLDEAVLKTLDGAGALCEYGPRERLVILPGIWAEDFRDAAVHISRVARQRILLPVRVALISFPRDGSRATNPVDYLERALEVCRAGKTSVSVGRPRLRRLTLHSEPFMAEVSDSGPEGGHGPTSSSAAG